MYVFHYYYLDSIRFITISICKQSPGTTLLASHEVQGQSLCRSARCPRKTLARFSRGAGAEPLPEREVSSQNPFTFILCRRRRHKMKTNEVVLLHITNNHHLVSSVQYIIDTKSSKTRFVLLLACSFCRIMLNSKWFKSLLDEHL